MIELYNSSRCHPTISSIPPSPHPLPPSGREREILFRPDRALAKSGEGGFREFFNYNHSKLNTTIEFFPEKTITV
jgi:hypothetical protein